MWANFVDVFDAERERLILFVPVGLGAGVASYFALAREPGAWPVGIGLLVAVAVGVLGRRIGPVRYGAIAAAALLLGVAAAELRTARAPALAPLPRGAAMVSGVVGAVELLPEGGRRVVFGAPSLDGAPPLGRALRVRLKDGDPAVLADGDTVRVRALVRPPAPPLFPGDRDGRRDAFFGGLAGAGFAIGMAERVAGAPPPRFAIAAWWRGVRDRIALRVERDLPGARGAIAATLLVGLGNAIPPADRQAFADSGLAHLLAVAGLHIGIVMGLALGGARRAFALSERASLHWPCKALSAVAALAAGGLYLLLTGAHVPIVRSFGMAALATLAIVLGRRALSMRGLAMAALLITLVWPDEVVGVSFQMSFAAVAALIAGYELARPAFTRLAGHTMRRRFLLHVAALALTSLLAGVASLPYAAAHFGRIQLYFVLANLVAVPLTATVVMPAGLLALALMPFGLERVALWPMGEGIGALLAIARAVAGAPGAVFTVPSVPASFLPLVSAGIALLCLLRTRLRLVGLVPLALAPLLAWQAPAPALLVTADAQLLAFPSNGALMVARGRGVSRLDLADAGRPWGIVGDPVRLPYDGTLGPVRCDPDRCRIGFGDAVVLLQREAADAAPDCRGVVLLVLAGGRAPSCAGAAVLNRAAIRRDGATLAFLAPSGRVRLRHDGAVRPWTLTPPPTARPEPRPTLPMVASD